VSCASVLRFPVLRFPVLRFPLQADLLCCAYASHGDTKHVLLFPEDPHECFEFAAAALDLAERLQTPVFAAISDTHSCGRKLGVLRFVPAAVGLSAWLERAAKLEGFA